MKTTSLLAAAVLTFSFAAAHAGEKFSALEGIKAEAMSANEMEAVQGKNDFGMSLLDQFRNGTDPLSQQLAAFNQGVVQNGLADPQVQAAYQQHLANGGGYSPEQFAYLYRATGGFSADGVANYNRTTIQIGEDQRRAMDDYYRSQQQYRDAYNAYVNGFSANQGEFGNALGGNGTFFDPSTGATAVLPVTLQPGTATWYNGVLLQSDFGGNLSYINQYGYAVPLRPVF